MSASAAVKIEKTNFHGWPNSYRLSNGEVELVVTGDVGPRVIRFAFVGGQNLFKEFTEQLGKTGETKWQARGGHRVWAAPEDPVLTYPADNFPVRIQTSGDSITATAPVEKMTGLEKTIVVKLAATGTGVDVLHRIKNSGSKPADLAVWALTMMAQGGTGIHGFPPRGKHPDILSPTNPLVMWAFTNFSDKRWHFTKKYVTLRQDPKATDAQKTGTFNPNTWGAYLLGSDLFIKRASADPKRPYADFGCSFETFTNADILELETLGPLIKLQPGASAEHTEHWTLHRNIKVANWTDAELDKVVLPLVGRK
jgi:hypothetical protein